MYSEKIIYGPYGSYIPPVLSVLDVCTVYCTVSLASFLVFLRFRYLYAAISSIYFLCLIPFSLLDSLVAQRSFLAGLLILLLFMVRMALRHNRHSFLGKPYAFIQAALWLALYLIINLQVSSVITEMTARILEVPRSFYWATYGFIFFIPALGLITALRDRDRVLLDASLVMTLLTLIFNKPYLGWPRYEWDPMILGVFLMGTALLVRRWLMKGENSGQNGITALRLLQQDKRFFSTLGTASGLIAPQGTSPGEKHDFGGGRSGGGGSTGNF